MRKDGCQQKDYVCVCDVEGEAFTNVCCIVKPKVIPVLLLFSAVYPEPTSYPKASVPVPTSAIHFTEPLLLKLKQFPPSKYPWASAKSAKC